MITQQTHDPAQILEQLPEHEHPWFLREYREAAHGAADDPERYQELQGLLRTWHLRALTRAATGYQDSRDQARSGAGEFSSLDDVLTRHRTAR